MDVMQHSENVIAMTEQQIGAALRLFCLRSRISAFFAGVSIEKDGEPNSADLARSARQQILIKLSVDV